MKTVKIKVKFTDSPFGFDPENNAYVNALRRKYEVEFSQQPDIVFYSVFGKEFLRYPNSVRIFLANEPVVPNFNDCDYAIGTVNMQFGRRYFRQPPLTGYGEESVYRLLTQRREPQSTDAGRKFCNFVYSNATNGSGAALRIQFCKELERYRHVDCPGRVLNNMSGGLEQRYYRRNDYSQQGFNVGWADSKLRFLTEYKFTIAFENVSQPGWITEKLIHPLAAGSVPIYWGAPDTAEYFNPKAFIDCTGQEADFQRVIQQVMELDRDEERYMEMLRQPVLKETYSVDWEQGLAEFLEEIIEGGLKPLEKNPMGYETMGAQDYSELCRNGKYGLRSILQISAQAIGGWAAYKRSKGHGEK